MVAMAFGVSVACCRIFKFNINNDKVVHAEKKYMLNCYHRVFRYSV